MEPPCLWKINVCAHLYGPQYENYGLGQILKYDMVLFMKFEQRRIESITRAKSSVMSLLQYKYQREIVRGAYSQAKKLWCGCTAIPYREVQGFYRKNHNITVEDLS